MSLFRPCIDLHSGSVKQIVGGSLSDTGEGLKENFVSEKPARYYAEMYQRDGLTGGHVVMLGTGNEDAAKSALQTYPRGLQVGGGINPDNALKWINYGASHVIVTSFMFDGATVSIKKVQQLVDVVGKDRLILDLSCKRTGDEWMVAKDRWQTTTDLKITHENLDMLSQYCSEFLVHAADVEGKCQGIDEDLVKFLGSWGKIPITYAGGAKSVDDLKLVHQLSNGKVHLTYGSALDIFGGKLVNYADCVAWNNSIQKTL
eukprot:TRINITY_DN5716_c1_g2_i1.p1 TRINITY_DN5716_c1_g2~~TRINITY_DN5716_c1_g2_i1.p1  ORF type:complete len:284 (+),score=48.31 TRINITY_DN5716_c1_g2_i1:76-852(+)